MSEQQPDTTEPSEQPEGTESAPGVIGDDQLPEDLRPTDDNPLAKNPEPDTDEAGRPKEKSEPSGPIGGSAGPPDLGAPEPDA